MRRVDSGRICGSASGANSGSDDHARALAGATTIELERLPKVAGAGEPSVSRALRDTVLAAHEEIAQFGDQFVSTEHLLLALLDHGDAKTQAVLADANVTRDRILKALQDIRGSQRVTSQQPEGTYDALSQNSRDRTAEAHARAGLKPGGGFASAQVLQATQRRAEALHAAAIH